MSMTEEAQITSTGSGDERNVEIKYECLCCAFVSGSQSFRHKAKLGGKTQKIPRNKLLSFILLGAKYSQQRVWRQSEKRRNQGSYGQTHIWAPRVCSEEGWAKVPGGRAVSVTVIFKVKMYDGKYKNFKSEMQTSAFCTCFQMISPMAQHCLGINARLCASPGIHYAPPRSQWAGTLGLAPSRMTAPVLSRTTEWDATPYSTQRSVLVTLQHQEILFIF